MFAKDFWHTSHMAVTQDAIDRLGRYVLARREDLGLSQEDIAAAGGPSTTTLSKLELGKSKEPIARTLRLLDKALFWEPGSAENVLRGGEPEATSDSPIHNTQPAIRIMAPKRESIRISGGIFDELSPEELAEVHLFAEAVARQSAREILNTRPSLGKHRLEKARPEKAKSEVLASPGVAYQESVDAKLRELAQSDYVPAASPDRRQDGNGDAGEHDQEPEHP